MKNLQISGTFSPSDFLADFTDRWKVVEDGIRREAKWWTDDEKRKVARQLEALAEAFTKGL